MPRIYMLIFCAFWLTACQPQAQDTQVITTQAVYSADISTDGGLLMISTANNGVQLWDIHQHSIKYQWQHGQDQQNTVIDTAISNNNRYAATLSSDSLAIWDINDGRSLGWWSLPAYAQHVAIADNGHTLVGLIDGSVMSLSILQNRLIQFLGHQEKVNGVAIMATGTLALSGDNAGKVILWQTQTGQPIHQWQMDSRISHIALSDDGKLSFAADITGNGTIWQNQDATEVSQLNIKRRQMNFSAAKFTQQNQYLLTGTPSKEVFLWQVDNGKRLNRWEVQLTKNTKVRGAVVYSVAQHQADKVLSISSKGLLETFTLD
ncbi:WD40 repeat domain-containing protein [Shewanella maritima]|uniref:WD40 repeat domain-containing protein n=1 Tax=Shewanella maritima TaxID=2520507 RepID=UPI003735AA4C